MSTSGTTTVVEVDGDGITSYELAPEDVGLRRGAYEDVAGGPPDQNAAVTRRIFAGESGPARDLAALNAGAAIYVAGRADVARGGRPRRRGGARLGRRDARRSTRSSR